MTTAVRAEGTLTLTPSKETLDAFEAMQERIAVLENALVRIPPPPAGLGHNKPPEPIEDAPLSAVEWAEMRQLIVVLKAQSVVPAQEPNEAIRAASRLSVIGEKLLSFVGRRFEEFSSDLAKKLGSNTADAIKWFALAYYGHAALKLVATDLISLSDSAHAWLHSIGF